MSWCTSTMSYCDWRWPTSLRCCVAAAISCTTNRARRLKRLDEIWDWRPFRPVRSGSPPDHTSLFWIRSSSSSLKDKLHRQLYLAREVRITLPDGSLVDSPERRVVRIVVELLDREVEGVHVVERLGSELD